MRATNTLFGEAVRQRPTQHDDAVRTRAVALMAAQLRAEFPDLGAGIEADLAEAMEWNTDGYDIAKDLEHRHHWAVDARLVAALDRDTTSEALHEAVRAWVRAEGIVPALAVGAAVTFADGDGTHVGEVVRVDLQEATYTVRVPALGHVRTGLGTHGFVLPYERVEAVAP